MSISIEDRLCEIELQSTSFQTPYTDVLHQLLNTYVALHLDPFNDLLNWQLTRLELKFVDTFGIWPPKKSSDIYGLIMFKNKANKMDTLIPPGDYLPAPSELGDMKDPRL